MTDFVWRHLPYAIYLDTNVLRAAGSKLDAPWLNELLSITTKYELKLCVSELVVAEWCEYIAEVLESTRQRILSSITLLEHYGVTVAAIKPDEIDVPGPKELTKMVSDKLRAAGFDVIPTWDGPLSQLLAEVVVKKPPFEERGKGLCDAVILESYAQHARDSFAEPRVLVVSRDGAVKRSGDRFKARGIVVDFLDEQHIVEKLKSLLNDEVAAFIEEEKRRLREYVLTYENTILEFVKKTPLKVTDWMFNPLFSKEEDRIYGTVESILSIKPTKITDVIGGAPTFGEETAQDRYPVRISVELELDSVVKELGSGPLAFLGKTRAIIQPDMLEGSLPVRLEREGLDLGVREITKTIKRDVTVLATLDAEKSKSSIFDDFRIEKIV